MAQVRIFILQLFTVIKNVEQHKRTLTLEKNKQIAAYLCEGILYVIK